MVSFIHNLESAIKRLETNQFVMDGDPFSEMKLSEGLVRMDDDVKHIQKQYTDSLWETMDILLPHYRTTKEE